jgi:hypothetical protein
MYMLEELFSQLPAGASLSLLHKVMLCQNSADQLVHLVERISADRTDGNVDIFYQHILTLSEQAYTTWRVPSAVLPLAQLITQLSPGSYFKVCAFCHFRFEGDIYGGSDGHRDMMYCFRDYPDVLKEARSAPQKSPSFPSRFLCFALRLLLTLVLVLAGLRTG